MRKPKGPCNGCRDRRPEIPETGQQDCHKTCERYQAFRAEIEQYHKELHERIRAEMIVTFRPWRHKRSDDADEK